MPGVGVDRAPIEAAATWALEGSAPACMPLVETSAGPAGAAWLLALIASIGFCAGAAAGEAAAGAGAAGCAEAAAGTIPKAAAAAKSLSRIFIKNPCGLRGGAGRIRPLGGELARL